jgi:DNA polymerase-3 subunit delta
MKIAPFQIDAYIQKIANEKIVGCLIFGPESSIVNHRFDLIAKKICPNLSDPFLVVTITKERFASDHSLIASEFYSISMLGGRKLIIIKELDQAIISALKELFLEKDFAKKSDNFILIQGGDLDKSSAIRKSCEDSPYLAAIACYEDDDRVIKKFIESELNKYEIKFNQEIVDFLLEKIGKNRQVIALEIEKISLFLGQNKELEFDKLLELSASAAEISANEFVMNFSSKNFVLALSQAQKLFADGFEAITLIRFLTNYLQKLYSAKLDIEANGMNFEEAVKAQRLFFKIEAEFSKQLRNISLSFLTNLLQELQNLEIKIKTSNIPAKLLFLDLIASLIKK